MGTLFSANKLNSALFFFIPVVIVASWINVHWRDYNYDYYSAEVYLIRFLVPAILIAYALSLMLGEFYAKIFKFTFRKVFAAFLITLTILYFAGNFVNANTGTNNLVFLTFKMPFNQPPFAYAGIEITNNPYVLANFLYPIFLIISIIILLGSYKLSSLIIKPRTRRKK